MRRVLPIILAGVVLALGGAVHGLWTDRWAVSEELEAATGRLHEVARSVGDWEGEDQAISPRELVLSGGTGCLQRRYVNRRSGEALLVLILCGRPGPISVHTPDVCYRGLGYEPTGTPVPWVSPVQAGGQPAGFWTARFRKEEPGKVSHLRIFWSWSATGTWAAHDNPRVELAHQPVLYKLYVVRQMADEDESVEDDPSVGFLQDFLPELERTLFAGK